MVKYHSDSEREQTRCRHYMSYSFRLTASFFFIYMHRPTDRIAHTTDFVVTPVVEHWLEREIAQWVHPQWRIDPTTHRTMSERSYHGATFRSVRDNDEHKPFHVD